jgi:DNA-binding HxlR family transcriptional regulator
MKSFLASKDCPIRNILSRLGDKWSLLVLVTLSANGTMRFNDIHKSIGDISQRMLTVTLRSLEADGLVSRTVYAEVPPKVEYCLTKTGHELLPLIQTLVDWAVENMQDIMQSREQHKVSSDLAEPPA